MKFVIEDVIENGVTLSSNFLNQTEVKQQNHFSNICCNKRLLGSESIETCCVLQILPTQSLSKICWRQNV